MIFAIHVSDCLNHTIIITAIDFEINVQTIDLKLTLNLMGGVDRPFSELTSQSCISSTSSIPSTVRAPWLMKENSPGSGVIKHISAKQNV